MLGHRGGRGAGENPVSLPMRIEPLVIGKATTAVQVGYVGVLLLLLAFDRDAPQAGRGRRLYRGGVRRAVSVAAYAQLFLRALLFGRRTGLNDFATGPAARAAQRR